MKQVSKNEILFDDYATIIEKLGEGYLNNNSTVNSDCTNNIYLQTEDEYISA
jgi:hypothetical protein